MIAERTRRTKAYHRQAPHQVALLNPSVVSSLLKFRDCSHGNAAHGYVRGARSAAHLILQPFALLLLRALCNSILLVANNSRQLTNVIMVSFGSAKTVNE